ncbi:MAG: histidine kinase dimerization/phosphoacceptor domain -containing protein [Pseudomonadota bacterium]
MAAAAPDMHARDELPYRLRQQSLLGDFGRFAMQSRDLAQILQRAADLCAQGLEAPYAKVLEFVPTEDRLELRAGVGWGPGAIDHVTLAADMESPAGYAYHTGQSVISNHLHEEARFRTPKLLADHGVKRAINVLIERGNENDLAYGVLEVDSPDPGQFDRADADFLAVFAGLLGIAIERQQADAKLAQALEYQALLTREMSHRVKNSLSAVVSLLRVQARSAHSEEIERALNDASSRVETIAQVHDHLWRGEAISFIELSAFVGDLCKKMNETTLPHTITCAADALVLSADHAVPLGLLINELVTNASKYAYPDRPGVIEVSVHKRDGNLQIEVSDHGIGLPEGFIADQPRKSLGFRLITGFVRQLGGRLLVEKNTPSGASFTVEMPILMHNDAPQPEAQ